MSSQGSGRLVKHLALFDAKIRHDFDWSDNISLLNVLNQRLHVLKLIWALLKMGDYLLSNFDLAKLHFDRPNIIRNFKIIYVRNFSLCCVQLLYIQTCKKRIDKSIIIGFGIILNEVHSIGLGFLWLLLCLLLNL